MRKFFKILLRYEFSRKKYFDEKYPPSRHYDIRRVLDIEDVADFYDSVAHELEEYETFPKNAFTFAKQFYPDSMANNNFQKYSFFFVR